MIGTTFVPGLAWVASGCGMICIYVMFSVTDVHHICLVPYYFATCECEISFCLWQSFVNTFGLYGSWQIAPMLIVRTPTIPIY